jgi:hypothetical protein
MSAELMGRDDESRRLLGDVRTLARRVRLAQRVTWLPLLVLALVTFGAIPVYRFGHEILSDCRPMNGGQACKFWAVDVQIYWLLALGLGYAVIAGGYARVAGARGVGTRVLPYAITGVTLVVLFTAGLTLLGRLDALAWTHQTGAFVHVLSGLLDFTGTVGLALLLLAWLERNLALLLFDLGYLVVVLVPIDFGWGENWGSNWRAAPMLVITGGLLLLGSAGFALAQRLRRPR